MVEYVPPGRRGFEIDLGDTGHRPWALPARGYAVEMSWHDLLFAHWAVAPELVRALMPRNIPLDTYDGRAWIGVVPFGMSNVRVRGLPRVPGAVCFPELNVRTYATIDGKPGVYFFSLDTISLAAVAGARAWFGLLYYHARMSMESHDGQTRFCSARWPSRTGTRYDATYGPTGPVREFGEFDRWLTERYCLYSAGGGGRVYRADIHHRRWPLQPAEADIRVNTMTAPVGLELPPVEPVLHFAEQINVVAWSPERIF